MYVNISDYKPMDAYDAFKYIVDNPGKEVQDLEGNKWIFKTNPGLHIEFRTPNKNYQSIGMDKGLKYKVFPTGSVEWAVVQMWMGKIVTSGNGIWIFRIENSVIQKRNMDTRWKNTDYEKFLYYNLHGNPSSVFRVTKDLPIIYTKEEQIKDYEIAIKNLLLCIDNEISDKAQEILDKYNVK